jgi:hypothetical protein
VVPGTTAALYGGGVLCVRTGASGTELYKVVPLNNPAIGTGITTDQNGRVRHAVHKRTFAHIAFLTAGTSKTITFDQLPAKTRVLSVIAETVVPFEGPGITAVTAQVGTEDDADGYILAHGVLASGVVKGLLDEDLGTFITRANAVQGGHIPSWTAAKELRVQLDSTSANLDQLTQGAIQVTVVVEYLG